MLDTRLRGYDTVFKYGHFPVRRETDMNKWKTDVRGRKIDFDELQKLLNTGLKKIEIARMMGVHRSAITRAVNKLKTLAPRVVTLEKAKAFAESQFDVMEDCLRDLRRLDEILDPVHRYNLGDRADFIALKRKTESRTVEEGAGKDGKKGVKAQDSGGQKAGRRKKWKEIRIETFDFSGDPRLIECRIIEMKNECRAFILKAWQSVADKDEIEAHRNALIETLREMDPLAAQRFVDKLKQKRLARHDIILN